MSNTISIEEFNTLQEKVKIIKIFKINYYILFVY